MTRKNGLVGTLIDLSHPLRNGQRAYPGDPELSLVSHTSLRESKYNLTRISMGTHQGTHVDAMRHIFAGGRTVDQLPLEWLCGPARVLRLPRHAGQMIDVADLRPHQRVLRPGARIIYETGWHRRFGRKEFFENVPSLTPEAARYLAERGIRLLGMDTPSPGEAWYDLHRILLGRQTEVVLLESLANLDRVPDRFTLAAFPLRLTGCDGSPVRAVAIV